MAVVNDLVTKFSFTGSVRPLSQYNASLGGSIKLLGAFTLATGAAGVGFGIWADRVLDGVDALDQLSYQSGVAAGKIQELNFIAGQNQSTSQAMESTIRSLSATIGSAAQQGNDDFSRLGISVRDASGQIKTADQVLEDVRKRFGQLNLSLREQQHFASSLGIDPSLLRMLNQTDSEMASLRERARELGVMTAEQTEQAADYKKSLNSMQFALKSVKQLIAVGVAPEMGRMADSFTQLLADNKDWIINGVKATIGIVGDMLAAFNRLLPVIALLTAGFVAWKIASIGLAATLGIIFSPIVLITAGIAGLLLLVDDLIVAFNGGKSVIADFFEEFLGIDIVPILHGIVDTAKTVIGSITELFGNLIVVFGGIASAIKNLLTGNFEEAWEDVKTTALLLLDTITKPFRDLFDWIGNAIKGLLPNWAINLLGLGDDSGGGSDSQAEQRQRQQQITAGVASGGAMGAMTDARQVNQTVSVNINTNDPAAAGRAVEESLQRQLDNANTQLGTGGR